MSYTFKQDAKDYSYVVMWLVICIVVLLAIASGLWFFGVFSSGVKGAGDVTKHQNSAQNREYWVSKYNNDYNKLQADKSNITTLKQSVTGAAGGTSQDKMNLQGAVLVCNQDVADYNGATQDLLGRKWLPDGLPASVNAADYCSAN